MAIILLGLIVRHQEVKTAGHYISKSDSPLHSDAPPNSRNGNRQREHDNLITNALNVIGLRIRQGETDPLLTFPASPNTSTFRLIYLSAAPRGVFIIV